MKKTVKMAMATIAVVAIATTSFLVGINYANNNTEAHINEIGEITVWNNNTCISTRELTTGEVSHVEANNEDTLVSIETRELSLVPIETVEQNLVSIEEKQVLTQNLVPASTTKETREQNLVPIKNKELTQTLVPASTTK